MTEEALFELAVGTPEAGRAALFDRVCAQDPALRVRVEALLAANALVNSTRGYDPVPTASYTPTEGGEVALIAGKYKLLERIGEGGMGSVWLAQQTAPVKRKVAVKLIKPGMDSKQVIARFEAERQALAMMDHPNIARVLDGGLTSDNRPFFVMELVRGLPITEYCDAMKLTPQQRLELFVPVTQAIQHAHQKGIIHRDIKPSNVLIALYDDRPVPKVIDFGVAKATGQQLSEHTIETGFGGVVGTPQYMSPEQATFNNIDIDTRSDVYSLGVLLYELLAGSPPFSQKDLARQGLLEMLRVVREVEPPRPSTKLSTADALPSLSASRGTAPGRLTALLRSELDWIVLKALEKDRTRRYDTANAFAADVQRYLAGEAVQAHPPGAGYRLKKFVRRHRGPVLVAGVVLAVLVAGIAGTTWGLIRAGTQRDRAVSAELQTEAEAKRTALERDNARAERDQKDEARKLELVARRAAQERVVRLHVRTGRAATERDEGFDALHWYAAAWAADGDNPERDSVHRLRIGATLRQLPELQAVRFHPGTLEAADFSPDGQCVLSHTEGGNAVELWSPETGRLRAAPLAHPSAVLAAEWTPDGRHVWTWANDHALRVWNAATGRMVGQPIRSAMKTPLSAVALSPDGKVGLVAARGSGAIEAVSVETGKPVESWKVAEDPVSLRFSPTGDRFACALEGSAVLWAPGQREPLATVPHRAEPLKNVPDARNPAEARLPLFANDGRRMVTLIPGSKGFAVWDAKTGKPVCEQKDLGVVNGVALSPSGRSVLSFGNGDFVGHCCVSETETGKRISTIVGRRNVSSAAFFPDEKSVLYRSAGSDVYRADIATGKTFGPNLRACGRGLLMPQVSPDGQKILMGEFDGIARVWRLRAANGWGEYDLAGGGPTDGQFATRQGRVRIEHGDGVIRAVKSSGESVALEGAPRDAKSWLSPDGRSAVLADGVRAFRVWDTGTGKPRTDWFSGPCDQIWNRFAAFTPDNKRLYTLTAKGEYECRDAATGEPIPGKSVAMKGGRVRFSRLSPDGRHLAVADESNSAFLFSTENRTLPPLVVRHTGQVWAVDFSPDGRYVATASGDLTARVWDLQSGGRPAGPAIRIDRPFRGIVFSPDGKSVLTVDDTWKPQLWDWRTGDPVAAFPQIPEGIYNSHWFSRDGRSAVYKPSAVESKPQSYSIDTVAVDRPHFASYVELLTSARMDETEAIVPLRIAQTRVRKREYQSVWFKLHPELAVPDPLDPAKPPTESPQTLAEGVLSPDEARLRQGEAVAVQFRVMSTAQSRDKNWYYLNSREDFRDAENFAVAIPNADPERLQKLGLPEKHAAMRGRTVIARGKMGTYLDKPQLIVGDDPVEAVEPE